MCVRGERTLFDQLDVVARAGEVVHVAGPNGAGKTSLLRILCGLLQPVEGDVSWRGESIHKQREAFHRELLYIGHAPAVKDELSVLENLRFSTAEEGKTRGDAELLPALDWAGLGDFLDLPARALSQGQRRRLALARLMVGDRSLFWVLDEPFVALDVAALGTLASRLREHLDRGGLIMLTTHQSVPKVLEPVRMLEVGVVAAGRRSMGEPLTC